MGSKRKTGQRRLVTYLRWNEEMSGRIERAAGGRERHNKWAREVIEREASREYVPLDAIRAALVQAGLRDHVARVLALVGQQ